MSKLTRGSMSLALMAVLGCALGAPAAAQQMPTWDMGYYGIVADVKGNPLNGVIVTVTDNTTNRTGSSTTPAVTGKAGTYIVHICDRNNGVVARANDSITVQVTDPQNRLGRTPRCVPSTFSLGVGAAAACIKRLDVTMY